MSVSLDSLETEKAYRLWLWRVAGVGNKTFARLVKMFGSAEGVWGASREELAEVVSGKKVVEAIEAARKEKDVVGEYQALLRQGIGFVCLGVDEEYPSNLAKIVDPPPVLYVRGRLEPEDKVALAVVGTRKPTEYGVRVTQELVAGLVKAGVSIVSGLARGIDGVGHRQALASGGRTIAVLGGAIDEVYPREHRSLASQIEKQGALLSVFGPGEPSLPGFFAARNRYVVGLSLGVLVTEGAAKSGTRISANFAREQGKLSFAVPGNIDNYLSAAPVEMIKEGAHLVTTSEEVVTKLKANNSKLKTTTDNLEISGGVVDVDSLSGSQRLIYQELGKESLVIDEIALKTGMSVDELGIELTLMEMEGVVRKVGEKYSLGN